MPQLRTRSLARLLNHLDQLPAPSALVLGGLLGLGVGAGLLWGGGWVGELVFVLVVFLGAGLAWSGVPLPLEKPTQPEAPDPVWADIPAGEFEMGSLEDASEQPIHKVRISAFRCQRTPMTRSLYREVMGQDPSWPEGEADQRPVNEVRWFDAMEFCNRWSERDGLSPCYRIEGEQVHRIPRSDGYRLLTEAEWEYACRAGTITRWSFGDEESRLSEFAWFGENAKGQPQPVAQKKPNPWGLYDMHGNVWEWVTDWHGDYPQNSQSDPTGPETGSNRVLRGGSVNFEPGKLRSAFRNWSQPEDRGKGVGFRCARSPRLQR